MINSFSARLDRGTAPNHTACPPHPCQDDGKAVHVCNGCVCSATKLYGSTENSSGQLNNHKSFRNEKSLKSNQPISSMHRSNQRWESRKIRTAQYDDVGGRVRRLQHQVGGPEVEPPVREDINLRRSSLSRESPKISTNSDVIESDRLRSEDDFSRHSFLHKCGSQMHQHRTGNVWRSGLKQHNHQDYENFKFPPELKKSSVINKNYSKTVQFKVNAAQEKSLEND